MVVKASPSAAFVVPWAELMLAFLVFPLDDPARLGQGTASFSFVSAGRVGSQYLAGSFSWPLDPNPSSGLGWLRQESR